jgi:hypothetical protein
MATISAELVEYRCQTVGSSPPSMTWFVPVR